MEDFPPPPPPLKRHRMQRLPGVVAEWKFSQYRFPLCNRFTFSVYFGF